MVTDQHEKEYRRCPSQYQSFTNMFIFLRHATEQVFPLDHRDEVEDFVLLITVLVQCAKKVRDLLMRLNTSEPKRAKL